MDALALAKELVDGYRGDRNAVEYRLAVGLLDARKQALEHAALRRRAKPGGGSSGRKGRRGSGQSAPARPS